MGDRVSRSTFWVRRQVEPIGLDLGARFVRMMQVVRHRGQVTVTACAQHEIAPGTYAADELDEIRVRAVASLLRHNGFVGREATVALSWDDLQIRNLRIPPMPEEEIEEAIRFDAIDRLGAGYESGEIRFIPAGDVRQGTELRQEVVILAARRSVVDARVALLARMGLRPAALDAAPCALFRGFERFLRREQDRNVSSVFVDLGHSGTRVVAARGPGIVFMKAIPIGGLRFDELIGEHLSMSPHEVVQLRRRLHTSALTAPAAGIGDEAGDSAVDENIRRAVLDALRPAIEQLSKEIALCLRYCSVTFRGPRAEVVTAVGGEACNRDLLQLLSDQVNVPFRAGRPIQHTGFEPDWRGADRRAGQPEWATALGLALKPVGEAVPAEVAR